MQENLLEPQKDHKNYIYVAVSDGIGSALMIDDRIHRGSAGFSGEIGHTSIHADGIPCSCGNVGCLECYVTMKALKKKFGFESYERMVDDAYLGDSSAIDIIEYIATQLSCALINSINLLELDAAILYGEFNYRPTLLRNMLEERINRMSVISRTHKIEVKTSSLTPDLVRASACAAIINMHFEQML
jgi:predicted NBD/HSP70 family sugar kinase